MDSQFTLPTITVDNQFTSVFSQEQCPASWRSAMLLSEQIPAVNFRWRRSEPNYRSDWHVAGDPTLIIVLAGCLRIRIRSGEAKDFSAGQRFIAKDFLPPNIAFDDSQHGHQAEVLGRESFEAIHIKLSVIASNSAH